MSAPYDFKENAKALLKRIGHNPGLGVNPALALVAVETALREAFTRGQEQAKGSKAPAKSSVSQGVPASQAYVKEYTKEYADECQHQWQEAFLDGRSVGSKCVNCEMLESDVRKQCDHYFVKTNAGEVCVACRTPRNPRR
ncbi:MAG: hypothetical protein ACJ763_03095 [Bdellovibrionia bacterium]